MIRVGFILSNSSTWLGGLLYLRNLIETIRALPESRLEPVLIVLPSTPEKDLDGFTGVEVLRTELVGDGLPLKVIRRGTERVIGRDLPLEVWLRRHRIRALSHSGVLGPRSSVPALAWIPDFQHIRMPEFFHPSEVAARNRGYGRIASGAQTVILSSLDAQGDLARFAPSAHLRSRVLHFTAGMVRSDDPRGVEYLAERYGVEGSYFFLPNQFWKHKNHRLVVDALGLLAARGRAPLVVATGKTEDRRNPGHFEELMRHAEAIGASTSFRVLGMIPYEDLSILSRHSVAMINPSFFEGWSTTVEEAKSLGKTILLSDIPVHREQAPPRGVFVPPDDPEEMANAMEQALEGWSATEDVAAAEEAAAALPARRQLFGETYQSIVEETVERVSPSDAP